MKFTGSELHSYGVPQNKIKFLVGQEFDSVDAMLAKAYEENAVKFVDNPDSIFNWIWDRFPHLPCTFKGNEATKMSKSALRRIMDDGGILINSRRPKANDEFNNDDFPIREFVWFPNGKKVTWV